jgi:hypothetical protein
VKVSECECKIVNKESEMHNVLSTNKEILQILILFFYKIF